MWIKNKDLYACTSYKSRSPLALVFLMGKKNKLHWRQCDFEQLWWVIKRACPELFTLLFWRSFVSICISQLCISIWAKSWFGFVLFLFLFLSLSSPCGTSSSPCSLIFLQQSTMKWFLMCNIAWNPSGVQILYFCIYSLHCIPLSVWMCCVYKITSNILSN